MRILTIPYALWSSVVDANGLSSFHRTGEPIDQSRTQVRIWAGDPDVIYVSDVDSVSDYDTWAAAYPSSVQVQTEDEALAHIVGLGAPITIRQTDGIPKFTMSPRRGKEVIYATHNFCDPQSWYSESVRVTGQVLTETDGITYALPHSPIVNLREGKVFDEEGLYQDQAGAEPGDPHSYQVKVYVDGVEASQRDPFVDAGGDYHVDYQNGTVVFASSQVGNTITADYSRAGGSGWIMRPDPGRYLLIDDAEVQFTDDIDYNTTLVMEIYGNADYFAPQLGLPSGTPIPIGSTLYKTVQQIIDEAVGVKPHVPAFLQSDPRRAHQNPVYTFPFRYTVARPLFSSLGMYTRIRLEGDTPFGGERATATFYMMSRVDPGPLQALTELSAT